MMMAQKRTKAMRAKGKDFTNVQTFNLFSAFNEDGKMKPRSTAFQDMESDEEEDPDEFMTKMQKKPKGGKGKGKKKSSKRYDDSDTDDEVEMLTTSRSSGRKSSNGSRPLDSPSPPPSPEFDEQTVAEIMQKNRAAAQVIQNLERTVQSYKIARTQDQLIDTISPVRNSPTVYLMDDHSPRKTITVKVRSRDGLMRFENFQMNATFDKIFADLGSMEGVTQSRIRVTRKGEDIVETDTPNSIKLHVADILDYVVVDGSTPAISYDLLEEEDFVIVRLRTNQRKAAEMSKRVAKKDTLQKMFEDFAAKNHKPFEKFKFLFDGDPISGQSTPEQLDMDEENVIDVEMVP